MKKIIISDYIYTKEKLLKNHAVVFDEKIINIAPKSKILKENKDAQIFEYPKNSLLFPGLINAHVHIEFSGNKTELSYGNFINWLYSVIENREDLMQKCDVGCMKQAIDSMLDSGITTFGAISSHAMDIEACKEAKQTVVFFNELIGSQANIADILFNDFKQRLKKSLHVKRKGFIPAVAIHSPYSVHPILIKKALEIVKKENLRLTAHFMESEAEREWLDHNSGDFAEFFTKLLKQEKAVSSADEFLDYFADIPTLFAHGINSNDEELQKIKDAHHTIVHCPISNRLLGNKTLDIKRLQEKGIDWIVATDGLSSNYALDLWEEMKISLFNHPELPLLEFATDLLDGVTKTAAKALNLPKGEIKAELDSDMIVLQLDHQPTPELLVHLIVRKYPIIDKFILGEKI